MGPKIDTRKDVTTTSVFKDGEKLQAKIGYEKEHPKKTTIIDKEAD